MVPPEDPSAADTAPASALFQATACTKAFDGCRVVAVDLDLVERENDTMVRRTLELLEPWPFRSVANRTLRREGMKSRRPFSSVSLGWTD
jgi:hypothetical protein